MTSTKQLLKDTYLTNCSGFKCIMKEYTELFLMKFYFVINEGVWVYGIQRHFQKYFSYIVVVSFIGGRNRSTQRKPPTCRKLLADYNA